jgi:hypothetical protein
MRRTHMIILSLLIVCIIVGCANNGKDEVFYIASDQWGSVVVCNKKEKYLLVASIAMSDLNSFRGKLLSTGISSDNLGALQYLFSLPYDYLIEGNEKDWRSIYQQETFTLSQRVNYMLEGDDDLSKIINIDTLESLIGNNTSVNDVMRVYGNLKKDDYMLRVYKVSQFFQPQGDISLNKRNMSEWLTRALEEIRKN